MCCVGLLWDMQNVSVISEHSFSAQCYQPRESELWGSWFKQAQANEHSEEKLSLRIILVNTFKCNVKVDQFYHICILMPWEVSSIIEEFIFSQIWVWKIPSKSNCIYIAWSLPFHTKCEKVRKLYFFMLTCQHKPARLLILSAREKILTLSCFVRKGADQTITYNLCLCTWFF